MRKIVLILLLLISINILSQESYYTPSQNKLVLDHSNKAIKLNLNYTLSLQFLGANYNYPSIDINYNIFKNIGFSIGGSVMNSNSTKVNLLSDNDQLLNNNYSYDFSIYYLVKIDFWKFNKYEILVGFDNKKMSIDKLNDNYSFEIKKIEERYSDYFIQSNFIRADNKNNIILGVKLSLINYKELINIRNDNSVNNYIDDDNYHINKPLYINTSISYLRSINKKNTLFINTYSSFGFSKGYLTIRNQGGTQSDSLTNLNYGIGLSYIFK